MIFKRFFSCSSKAITVTLNPLFSNFMGAGCVFTDGKHVLAGYQPHKKNPCITGIGGHREKGENYYQTAFRETVEELYHVSKLPPCLVPRLMNELPPKREDNHNNYIILNYTFDDFKKFLKICKKAGLVSPVYKTLPRTLMEAIKERDMSSDAEISHLCLLPVIPEFSGKSFVHPAFVKDMRDM